MPVINPDCDTETMLDKIYDYLTDLKHYTETKRKKKVINTIFRKFKRILAMFVNDRGNRKLNSSLRVFFREIHELFKIFGDEMEIFLVRKIHNLGKSILKCIHK